MVTSRSYAVIDFFLPFTLFLIKENKNFNNNNNNVNYSFLGNSPASEF